MGNRFDYKANETNLRDWFIIHACKEPYHRDLLGYTGKEHPEYLLAKRKNRFRITISGRSFSKNKPFSLHCNLGESQSPGLLYLAVNRFISNSIL
ncbi:hypothetical protein LIMHP_04495 [Leptospira interrogans serovar Manilae]|nr:hypothetical protein LIMLP_04510 [Leptospira interrogans serovar Manilae]AKP31441.1 hypothetical protein LIMHP_04495 [Leptospira interrogans serovar Manilae]